MFRALFVTLVFATAGLASVSTAQADDRHPHHCGYSNHGHSHSRGFIGFSYGNPGFGYYGRPVYPAYGYPAYGYGYPAYRPYYGGCGGYGYPAYGYRGGFAIGFGF